MKKLNKVILTIILILIPINVLACPHTDQDGELHLQIYNGDYTIATMIYPKDGYLYAKDAYMEITGSTYVIYEENTLKEKFGFPIYQEVTSYITYYWFLDSTLLEQDLDEIDVETNVANYDSMYVEGDGYNLTVGLTNSYTEGTKLINDLSYQLYYEVNVEKVNDSDNYLNLISEYDLTLVSEDIYDFDINYMVSEIDGYNYSTEYVEIDTLYDDVEVSISSENYNENAIVINLNEINSNNFIDVSYENGYYNFSINKNGVYVIAEYTEISEEDGYAVQDDVIVLESDDTDDEESSNYIMIIILVSAVVILTISVVVVVSNKKKN